MGLGDWVARSMAKAFRGVRFMMRHWILVGLSWWFGLAWCGLAGAQFQNLAPATQARIQKYGTEAEAIVKRSDKKILAAGKKLTDAMDKQLKVLTKARRLEEATSLKQLRDSLVTIKTGQLFENTIGLAKVPPSAGMHGAIGQFLVDIGEVNEKVGKELTKLRDGFLADLDRLPDGKSPAISQFRQQILATINPDTDGEMPNLPKDPEEARVVTQRYQTELRERYEKRWKRELIVLIGKLQPMMDQATEEDRLEEANAIQELLKRVSENPDPNTVGGFVSSQGRRLPARAVELMEEYARWHAAEFRDSTEKRKGLERASVPQEAQALKELMRSPDTPLMDLRWQIQSYLSKKGERSKAFGFFDSDLPPPRQVAAKLIAEFDQQAEERLAEANRLDAEERKDLLDALRNLTTKVSADSVDAQKRVMEFLAADYAEGIRGLMLLEVDEVLDVPAKRLIADYREDGLAKMKKVRNEHAKHLAALRDDVEPVRLKHVENEEFVDAFAISAALVRRKYAIEPIWICLVTKSSMGKYARPEPWKRLIDVGENGYLVDMRQWDVEKLEWLTRDEVTFLIDEVEFGTNLYHEHTLFSPASGKKGEKPIDSKVRLRLGQKVNGYRAGGGWEEITVDDLSPFGIVKYLDGSQTRFRIYPRSVISLK